MYDFLHRRKRLVQFVLALITLPFAFFGIDYYFRSTGRAQEVASVSGQPISQEDFAQSMREQQERMRQAVGANFDPTVFDDPEVRYSILEQMINQRLLQEQARHDRFRVSDAQLAQFISEIPAFQVDGKFSHERYEQLLQTQSRTPAAFEQEVRAQLTLAPIQEPVGGANIVARSNVEHYLGLLDQQREVSAATIDVEPYMREVKIDDAAVKTFYDANPDAFQVPEEVKLEYVTLSPDTLAAQTPVDAAEVRKQYDDNLKRYGKPEERQASHILIAVKPDASDADKAAAKKRAEEVAAQAKKNPGQFAELAKSVSQDPGSASQGGDLGFFGRDGSMVKPFEDAVFSMKKEGEIAGPIQTDFGWHIIKLTGIHPGKQQSFDEVRAQIEQDLKRQTATRKFAEAADQLQNLVYEQADSLQPVAKALNLNVQTTQLITRAQVQALALNNAKFVQAVFSPSSLQAKRNTEAIEVAPNTLMAARVVEYKPAAPRAFDDVKTEIRRQLERKAASDLAHKAGMEKLALLEQGKDAGLAFGKPVVLARSQPQPGFPPSALTMIFQTDTNKLPAYVGAGNERGGYSIFRVQRLISPPAPDAAKLTAYTNRVGEQLGRELMNAYAASLRNRAEVKINEANLEPGRETGSTEPSPAQPRRRGRP
ncbi:MAG TPA: SurA N-terminal domain-containing protein [Casimicrobiaceae bacterium]|nr:SurA N-terminal domain-containing protein [Casimicrobiaceae bacterium]